MSAHHAGRIQALVFDMDGVLIDSEPVWERVRLAVAKRRGRNWSHESQVALMGMSAAQWSRRMCDILQIPMSDSATLESEVLQGVQTAYAKGISTRAGALRAVSALAAQWPLALASGSPRPVVEQAMAQSGLAKHFACFVTGEEVTHGKPNPEIYLQALRLLGVAPDQAVGVEDAAHGLQALRAAGMWAIAAPHPDFALPTAALALAHAQVAHLDEINPQQILRWFDPTAASD